MNSKPQWAQALAAVLGIVVTLATVGSITCMAAGVAESALRHQTYGLFAAVLLALAGAYFSAAPTFSWVRESVTSTMSAMAKASRG